jgi:hypothetical protein
MVSHSGCLDVVQYLMEKGGADGNARDDVREYGFPPCACAFQHHFYNGDLIIILTSVLKIVSIAG